MVDFVLPAQVVPLPDQRAVGMASGPPGAQAVLEQELHHVVFGEELGDGVEVGAADLALAAVDLVLFLRLPELVDPAQAVVGREDGGGQSIEQRLQFAPSFRGKAHLYRRIVLLKEAGQHGAGVTGRHFPAVGSPLFCCQILALCQGHGHTRRVHEQTVLGQDAGKEHAVPLLVGDLLDQSIPALADAAVLDRLSPQLGSLDAARHGAGPSARRSCRRRTHRGPQPGSPGRPWRRLRQRRGRRRRSFPIGNGGYRIGQAWQMLSSCVDGVGNGTDSWSILGQGRPSWLVGGCTLHSMVIFGPKFT